VLLSLSPACTCLSCERCATTNTPESLGRRLIPPATPGTASGFRPRRRNGEIQRAPSTQKQKWPLSAMRKGGRAAGRAAACPRFKVARSGGGKVGVRYLVKVGGLLRGLFHHMAPSPCRVARVLRCLCQRSSHRHGEINSSQDGATNANSGVLLLL
jgi:hypothetical protein